MSEPRPLTSTMARYLVMEHLELDRGVPVYELRPVAGRTLPQLAYLGEDSRLVPVQVQVGKRPPRSRGLHVDKRRVPTDVPGLLVAVVDPRDHQVHLVSAPRASEGPILVDEGKDTSGPPESPHVPADGAEAATGD
jgi:hypothetical protein